MVFYLILHPFPCDGTVIIMNYVTLQNLINMDTESDTKDVYMVKQAN